MNENQVTQLEAMRDRAMRLEMMLAHIWAGLADAALTPYGQQLRRDALAGRTCPKCGRICFEATRSGIGSGKSYCAACMHLFPD